jgi:hypothetical protein
MKKGERREKGNLFEPFHSSNDLTRLQINIAASLSFGM